MSRFLSFSLFVALLSATFPFSSFAATTVTDFTIRPTTIEASTGSNYRLYLTVPNAIPEDDTLTLTFASGFTMTGIDEDDVDILDDSAQLETAATCSGSTDASVVRTGQAIAFAICNGGGGAIAAGSTLEIRIGTIATSSGTGNSTITNPATVGRSYGVAMTTVTNAMTGSALVPIVTNDDGSVSATTPTPEDDGGGGGPGPGDPQPPDEVSTRVVSPNGGEVFHAGEVAHLRFFLEGDSLSAFMNIRYSTDGGATFRPIVEGIVSGENYTWTVPDVGTTAARIKVELSDLSSIFASDISDADFTIIGTERPTATVMEPNGGEVLYRNEDATLVWSASSRISYVDLEYSDDRGDTYAPYARKLPVAQVPGGRYVIRPTHPAFEQLLWRVRGYELGGDGSFRLLAEDVSDGYFALRDREVVAPAVRVVAPNGGERFPGGESTTVRYEASSSVEGVDIALSTDDGRSWATYSTGTSATGTYDMMLPYTATTSARVRVQALRAGRVVATDISDRTFVIEIVSNPPEDEVTPLPLPDPDPAPTDDGNDGGGDDGGSGDGPTSGSMDEPVDAPDAPGPVVITDGPLSVEVTTTRGALPLPIVDGRVEVLQDTSSRVIATLFGVDARSIVYALPDRVLTPVKVRDGVYASDLGVSFAMDVMIRARTDASEKAIAITLLPVGYGVVRTDESGELVSVEGAAVTVYRGGQVYDADIFGWSGTSVTDASGTFGGYVENGTYQVIVSKDGYDTVEQTVVVRNNILNPIIVLSRPEIMPLDDRMGEVFTDLLGALGPVREELAAFRANPEVQEVSRTAATTFVAPAALVTAVALGGWFQGLSLLQYLFASPLLFLTSRRRNAFGVVYHAVTKGPVQLATVRLFNEQGRLIRSVVTDFQGRFYLRASPGKYRLQVMKPGFVFPSTFLAGEHQDGRYTDLYTGGTFEVGEHSLVAAMSVPLDPIGRTETDVQMILYRRRRERFRRVFVRTLAPLGLLASMAVSYITPSPFTKGLLAVQALIYLGSYLLVHPAVRKGFASVRGGLRRLPVKNAFVRLFDTHYNKLVETTVTDDRGRYAFMAGPSTYDLSVEHPEYVKAEVKGIEVSAAKQVRPVAVNVDLAAK